MAIHSGLIVRKDAIDDSSKGDLCVVKEPSLLFTNDIQLETQTTSMFNFCTVQNFSDKEDILKDLN